MNAPNTWQVTRSQCNVATRTCKLSEFCRHCCRAERITLSYKGYGCCCDLLLAHSWRPSRWKLVRTAKREVSSEVVAGEVLISMCKGCLGPYLLELWKTQGGCGGCCVWMRADVKACLHIFKQWSVFLFSGEVNKILLGAVWAAIWPGMEVLYLLLWFSPSLCIEYRPMALHI